jgi:predicted amidohydrolase
MRDLKVTLIQSELIWEDIEANLKLFEDKINNIQEETDLIILPEMFTTGFSMKAKILAQDMNGSAVLWMQEKSKAKNADIVGSLIISENGKYFNRVVWAKPDGSVFTYDKKHLFRLIGEQNVYTAGEKHLTATLYEWKIRPFICYDMRFPIWTRNMDNQYDIAVYIANWPEKRALQWDLLMPARAIENQCYVIGVNRVGADGKGHKYIGGSSVIDPTGRTLFKKENVSFVKTISLSYDAVKEYREQFPAWMDADRDMICLD